MIELTRLNDSPLVLNAELIEIIESTPDTVITLTTGKKVMVRESVSDVREKVLEYRRSLYGPGEGLKIA